MAFSAATYVRQSLNGIVEFLFPPCLGPGAPRSWCFWGPHTPALLHFSVPSVLQTCTQKINEFSVDTNTLKPPPFIIKCDLCECTPLLFCPPVLRERTALPLITHTLLSATCGFRNLVLLCVSRNSPCNPQKTSANLPRLRGRVPLSGGGNSVCSYSGVCDISSSGSGNLEENIVKCGVITR